jgi:hypothetical protein
MSDQPAANPVSWIESHIQRYLTDPQGAQMWDSSMGGRCAIRR